MNRSRLAMTVLVLVLAAAGTGGAQGLGDAARREKARRAEPGPKEPGKVYTNDTILPTGDAQPSRGTYSTPAGDTPASTTTISSARNASPAVPRIAATSTASAASGPIDSRERGESYWRMRVQQARDALSAAERRVQELEVRANQEFLESDHKATDCTTPRLFGESRTDWRERAAARTKACEAARKGTTGDRLEKARQEAVSARKALDDLLEEARRAGALPGWLR
jgi:hypothetical protein